MQSPVKPASNLDELLERSPVEDGQPSRFSATTVVPLEKIIS